MTAAAPTTALRIMNDRRSIPAGNSTSHKSRSGSRSTPPRFSSLMFVAFESWLYRGSLGYALDEASHVPRPRMENRSVWVTFQEPARMGLRHFAAPPVTWRFSRRLLEPRDVVTVAD